MRGVYYGNSAGEEQVNKLIEVRVTTPMLWVTRKGGGSGSEKSGNGDGKGDGQQNGKKHYDSRLGW